MDIETKCINTIRCLAMDAVQKANSGHPGTPMALAPAAFVLWNRHLIYNPSNPKWFNRDRFVLSCGHASMLQYALLHLTGYDLSLEDIKQFRQWESKTPGHPEYSLTPGIEVTTGPLGQGIMNAVGMAIAEAHLAAIFNKEEEKVIDHYTYAFCSDGDLMEGASHEAASVAGHLGLGKLICLYDDNHITIEGNTSISYSDNVAGRFEGYNWQVINLGDKANDIEAISDAFSKAKEETTKPTLIILRTHIAYGSPNKHDTSAAHGSPLGEDEIKLTKKFYQWPEDEKFLVPDDVKSFMDNRNEGRDAEMNWNYHLNNYKEKYPEEFKLLNQYINQELPSGWDNKIPEYKSTDAPKATRSVSADVINAIESQLPWLMGGSGDLEPSTETIIKSSKYFEKNSYQNRNMAWGIREHVMCAASSGITLHGGLRIFAATFFVFTDYARPAIRLACIMKLPVIYVMTHDSIGLGEDGTTHQPIEHLASFRAMPGMTLIRPADANEAAYAWRAAIENKNGPVMLVLTRQKLSIIDRNKYAAAEGVYKGAYILLNEKKSSPDIILIATGSEVELALQAAEKLEEQNIDTRVISMPSWELFRSQPEAYRSVVLPPASKKRIAIEAGSSFGWHEWIGDEGKMIGVDHFGSSAPYKELYNHYGLTVDHILATAKGMILKNK